MKKTASVKWDDTIYIGDSLTSANSAYNTDEYKVDEYLGGYDLYDDPDNPLFLPVPKYSFWMALTMCKLFWHTWWESPHGEMCFWCKKLAVKSDKE